MYLESKYLFSDDGITPDWCFWCAGCLGCDGCTGCKGTARSV